MSEAKPVRLKNSLISWRNYLIFFLIISLIVTSCFIVFFQFKKISFQEVIVSSAATLGNVLFIVFFSSLAFGIYRHFSIEKPVNRILEYTETISRGEFGTPLKPVHKNPERYNEFDLIINNLSRMSKELSGIETLRADFISNVSHELKTPLAAIQNYAVLLQSEDISKEERLEYAQAITGASKHLNGLITNVLRLNKLENQTIFPAAKEYDLSEQLVQTLLSFETIWEEKEIEIETDIEENIRIQADEELLSVVFSNLLSNAMKFTPEHGTVTVRLRKENDHAVVTVSDTGEGMNEETMKHIFDKFYQGDTSHSVKGNGLGLALVRRILSISGGKVDVSSKPGEGSTFTVTLPLRP